MRFFLKLTHSTIVIARCKSIFDARLSQIFARVKTQITFLFIKLYQTSSYQRVSEWRRLCISTCSCCRLDRRLSGIPSWLLFTRIGTCLLFVVCCSGLIAFRISFSRARRSTRTIVSSLYEKANATLVISVGKIVT